MEIGLFSTLAEVATLTAVGVTEAGESILTASVPDFDTDNPLETNTVAVPLANGTVAAPTPSDTDPAMFEGEASSMRSTLVGLGLMVVGAAAATLAL